MIRQAIIEDLPEIYRLEKECFEQDAWTEQNFLGALESGLSKIFVYQADKKIVGYAVLTVVFDEAHLDNIAVSSRYRRQGIGRQLILYILRYLENIGINKITLEVRISNTAAINLYKSLGFVIEGVRKKYYEDLEDAYIMWRYDDRK
ncbi:MAG TPA: ribosomal protein S18-alanine N-acetyltransferase, partial [Clostridia bacterium]